MKRTLHNITILSKETGKKIFLEDLDSSLTPREITEKYADILTYRGVRGIYVRKLTRFQIDSESPIGTSDIKDGETLIAMPEFFGGGGMPVRSYKDIHLLQYIIEKNKSSDQLYYQNVSGLSSLYAVILCTDQDQSLSSYIRENVRDLHAMSNFSENDQQYANDPLFFVIEKPSDEWRIEIEKDLGDLADMYFDSVWEKLEGNIYKPYDKTKAYEIARHFNVSPDQLPCVVFFTSLESYQVVVVEIEKFTNNPNSDNKDYTKFFRMLFSKAQDVIMSDSDTILKKLSNSINLETKKNMSPTINSAHLVELANSIIGIIANLISISKTS